MCTGAVVPEAGCPPHQVGNDRLAVSSGKRFIRIPQLEDSVATHARWLAEELELQLLASVPDHVRRICSNGSQARMRQALAELAHTLACDKVAQHWLAALEPDIELQWIDAEGFRTKVYDPQQCAWVDADYEEFAP